MAIVVLSANRRLAREIERELVRSEYDPCLISSMHAACAARHRVECVVLDLHISGGEPGAAIRQLRASGVTAPVIAINICGSAEDRMHALRAGAVDCLPNPVSVQELVLRISILLHRSTPPPATRFQELTRSYGLTAAEAKVAGLLLEGKNLEQVAAQLHISQHTVRSQLKSIFHKTGARRQAELVWLLLTADRKNKTA